MPKAGRQARELDDVDTRGNDRKRRPSDVVDIFEWKNYERKYVSLRLFGGVMTYGVHWVKTKKKDGGPTSFMVTCSAYDLASGRRDSTRKCAWCNHMNSESGVDSSERKVRFAEEIWMNGIIRVLQKNRPEDPEPPTASEEKTGIKEKDSDSWTPVRAIRLSASAAGQIKDLKQLNTVETADGDTVAKSLTDPKYGRDVKILYDSKKAPAQQYTVQMGEKVTPLKRSERECLIYDLEGLHEEVPAEENEAEYRKWAERMGIKKASSKKRDAEEEEFEDDPDTDDDLDEEEERRPRRGAKKPAGKKRRAREEEEEELDDDDLDAEEEEDDPPRRRAGKKPAGKKVRVRDDDLDDDLDGEEEEELEEEEEEDDPPPRRKASKKPAAKKRRAREEEEEEGFEEEEEEDDPPPRRGKSTSKRRAREEEEEELDDDDLDAEEEEEEEDDPPPRRKAGKKTAAKKPSSKRRAREEEEEEDFGEEEEEEEDDPPPRRRTASKKPAAKKAGKKRRPAEEDDDFDEDDL